MPELPSVVVRCSASVGALTVEVQFKLTRPWTVLFGPSGSGKSSMLRLVAGLWMPGDATVHLGGYNVTRRPSYVRRIVLVAQHAALFPHLNVLGNIRYGCTSHDRAGLVPEMMELMGIGHLQQARTAQLSGGERQRVALARALASAPRLLLLDEVFTGMHREQRTDLLERVRAHCMQHGIPVLSVTHDVAEAIACADEVIRIADGRVVAQGAAADVLAEERAALLRQLN